MRATQFIKQLEEMVRKNGDFYMVYQDEEDMQAVEKVEVIPYHETKYFCIS